LFQKIPQFIAPFCLLTDSGVILTTMTQINKQNSIATREGTQEVYYSYATIRIVNGMLHTLTHWQYDFLDVSVKRYPGGNRNRVILPLTAVRARRISYDTLAHCLSCYIVTPHSPVKSQRGALIESTQ